MRTTDRATCRHCHGTGLQPSRTPLGELLKFEYDDFLVSLLGVLKLVCFVVVFAACFISLFNIILQRMTNQ